MRPAQTLLTPFRRDGKRDLAHGSGEPLLASKVRQVLFTRGESPSAAGELPWRTSFGAGLELLRHRAADETLRELARVIVRDALRRWLPEVELRRLSIEQQGTQVLLRLGVAQGADATDVSLVL